MLVPKFQNEAFSGMVQSTFISALPIPEADKSNPMVTSVLKNYCSDALESLGGYSLLENAIRTETNLSKLSLLNDIRDTCMSVAKEAANEYSISYQKAMEAEEDVSEDDDADVPDDLMIEEDEEDIADPQVDEDEMSEEPKRKILVGKTLEEIAIDSRLEDADYKKLAKKAESIDIPEISEIINKKVVDAINNEKESYEEIDRTNEKLKNALIENEDNAVENDDEAREAATRIMDRQFGCFDNKEHKTLFSKLQLDATEMAMCSESAMISERLLKSVTYNDTLSAFSSTEETLGEAIESALNFKIANECADPAIAAKAVKIGTMSAAIVLTFLETLNTLNLYKVSFDEAKQMVCKPPMIERAPAAVLDSINSKSAAIIDDQRRSIRAARDVNALESANYKLSLLKKDLTRATESGINISKEVLKNIDVLQETAMEKINRIDNNYTPASEAVIINTKKAIESNVVTANQVAKYIAKRPSDHIFFRIANEGTVAVECFKNNKYVYGSTIKLQPVSEAVSAEKYIETLVKTSDLGKIEYLSGKPKMTVLNRGSRTDL